MKGLNKVIVAGNLARDPDVRYTVNKRAWARFSVAVGYRYKDNNGEYKDMVDYVPVSVWGPQAENCGKYLKKGSPVLLEGRIVSRSYEANDGSGKKYITEVNADNVIFLGSGQGSSSGQSSNSGGYSQMPSMGGDSGYGMSIGESNFGGDMPQGFSGGNANDETDIPF